MTGALRDTLAAAAARILPSDDGPGAAETGVAEYVERALGEERLAGWAPLFEHGLGRLDGIARERFAQGFAACPPEEQDATLRALQELPEPPLRQFFSRLVTLCLEGFLGDPACGGNRDGLGWVWAGLPRMSGEDDCLGATRT